MRLVLMGTGPFAVPTFRSLLESPHSVLALVTRPTVASATRGKVKAPSNPARELAESYGLPVLDPPEINSTAAHRALNELQPDLFIVCDYGQILSPETLTIAPLGGINLHGSLLPKYRGAAPIQWAIWRGEQETGVTVIHMTPRLDAGPCLVQRVTPIGTAETATELEPRLAELGVAAVHEAIALLEHWDRTSPIGTFQDAAQATRAPRLKKSDGNVDWSRPATEIVRQYRAMQPWPGLFTHYLRTGQEPLRVILESVAVVPCNVIQPPGTLMPASEGRLVVATGSEGLSICRLQPAGRRSMDAAEFLRGYSPEAGARFGPLSTMHAA